MLRLYGNVYFGLCKIKYLTPIDIILMALKMNSTGNYSKKISTTVFPFIWDDTIVDKTTLFSFSSKKKIAIRMTELNYLFFREKNNLIIKIVSLI